MNEITLLGIPLFQGLRGDLMILRSFGIGVGALLVGAGLLLAVLQLTTRKDLSGIWATYRGWWMITPAVALAFAVGRVGIIVGVILVSLQAFKELARATGLYRDRGLTMAVNIAIVGLGITALVYDPRKDIPGWYGMFMALPVYGIALIVTIPILRNRTEGQLQGIALSVLSLAYVGWMLQHLAFLANLPNSVGYLLYLVCAVQINDVAAFTFGRLFGRSMFRSEISPNKTWAGALGALAVSMALPWLLRFAFPHFGTTELLLTGLIVGVGGQLGDLTISFIKRDLGVKDMGAMIPGHGGLLDRVDSLTYVAPLFFHMVRWFHGAT
jgi:phosphatidate cytidylyltransferase